MLSIPAHCTVYHGTTLFSAKVIRDNGIMLDAQRALTDFGQGFYVAPNRKQAIKWAQIKAKNRQVNPILLEILGLNEKEYLQHPETKTPACLTFSIDASRLLSLRGLIFPMPDNALWQKYKAIWKSFVQNCRNGATHNYDFVYGPIGSSHNGSYQEVKPSKKKVQLSLNSVEALKCLSNPSIAAFASKKLKAAPFHHTVHRSSRQNQIYHNFIKNIRNEVINISRCSERHAAQLVENSWPAAQIQNQHSMIFHEFPEFWAFFILFGNKKLWYQHFETYLKTRHPKH